MEMFRIAQAAYKDDISGYGAYLYGGRWNSKRVYALYASSHISLAVLEVVVNYDRSASPVVPQYSLLTLQVPEGSIIYLDTKDLKKNWQADTGYSRFIGDHFLQDTQTLVLAVPSAVIPEEYNFLINPNNPAFKKIKITQSRSYGLDARLF